MQHHEQNNLHLNDSYRCDFNYLLFCIFELFHTEINGSQALSVNPDGLKCNLGLYLSPGKKNK